MSTDMHEPTTGNWRRAPLSRIPKGGPDGGILGGVIAGVSRAYGFDRRTTRIATVIAMIILPVLVLVYLAAWVLFPESPATAQPIDAIVRDRRRTPLLIVIGLVLIAGGIGSLGSWFLFDGAPWGVLLVALGVLLWMTSTRGSGTMPPPPAGHTMAAPAPTPTTDPWATSFPPPTPESTLTGVITGETPTTVASPAAPVTSTVTATAVAAPRRPRWPIGSIGVGVAALWVAGAAAGEALGWWDATALWIIVSAIGIVMLALLVSTVVNRSWLLPFPFVFLGSVLLMLCIAQPNLDGASGERTVLPATITAAQEPQHLAAGQLTIDLRDVPLRGETVHIDAEVGMGQLRVLVPMNADLILTVDVGAGQSQLDGNDITTGLHQQETRNSIGSDQPADGIIDLDLRVGMGQIAVERVASES
jgi:phage shock protein PspC (stress-responsive transcriptional regulator)